MLIVLDAASAVVEVAPAHATPGAAEVVAITAVDALDALDAEDDAVATAVASGDSSGSSVLDAGSGRIGFNAMRHCGHSNGNGVGAAAKADRQHAECHSARHCSHRYAASPENHTTRRPDISPQVCAPKSSHTQKIQTVRILEDSKANDKHS